MQLSPRKTIEEFFHRIGSATSVDEIAELVSEDVDWFVAGDISVVPWIGRKIGKSAVAEFYAQLRTEITSEQFELKDILALGSRVVAIGELASRVNKTGKLIETEFVFDFIVEDGLIKRFRLFEDSFAVAQAVLA
ncbi:nuclear transport factor 2 family protein [Hohaiivirga grylli]|uniref:nuclear transport factor 2 family protein n=1 Tax=Hohaiivirga grylli TaxID=3133970 RepID=UPI00387E4426